MGSTRLPGKVMKKVLGKSFLEYHIMQALKSKNMDNLIVATTKKTEDDKIVNFCKKKKINFFRGSSQDVLSRYYFAAKKYNADIIIRITSDCPLIDPKIIDKCIKKFLEKKIDYLSNTCPTKGATYSDGMDVEVFSKEALETAYYECNNSSQREHVTHFFWKNPKRFKIMRLDLKKNMRHLRLTLDYKSDFKLLKKIIFFFNKKKISLSYKNIIKFLSKNKNLNEINKKHNPDIK
jgi:spore coat polysaccharide biosynthesis protein SpsF